MEMNLLEPGSDVEVLDTFWSKLRGLLGKPPDCVTRVFKGCNSVHTFGMRQKIDVAFLSAEGQVLSVYRSVGARRVLRCKKAALVAERFSNSSDWLEKGKSYESLSNL